MPVSLTPLNSEGWHRHLKNTWQQELQLSLFCLWNCARSSFEGVLKMKTSGSWHTYNSFAKDKLHAAGIFN